MGDGQYEKSKRDKDELLAGVLGKSNCISVSDYVKHLGEQCSDELIVE